MNLTFHIISGFGVTAVTLTPDISNRSMMGKVRSYTLIFLTAMAVHGILDLVPHQFPLTFFQDLILSTCLLAYVFLVIPRCLAGPSLVCLLGTTLPDLIDKGPEIVCEYAGVTWPNINLFFWHWPQYSGAIYNGSMPITSFLMHSLVILVSGSAVLYRLYLADRKVRKCNV